MVHHFGREALQTRPAAAALRAAAPFISLRLRHEDRGEEFAVGALRSVSVFVNFALDVKIGAVRDRPTQSMHITCVCRT